MNKLYAKYPDEKLFELLKEGDTYAYTELFNRYWDKLYMVAANKLNDCFLAEDVVQELFIEIWHRKASINILTNVHNYLASALKYKIITVYARRRKEQDAKSDPYLMQQSEEASTLQMLSFNELQAKLESLVIKLPEKCQLVYRMNREDGLSSLEISQKLKISQKTVDSHLYRALKVLKKGLKGFSLVKLYCKIKYLIFIAVFRLKNETIITEVTFYAEKRRKFT